MEDNPPAISAEKLSQLTGTSVPDLERLAKLGYLPARNNAGYPMAEAINGWFRWNREAPVLVSGDELRTLSGLSDQRHRQLAAEGHFPPPIRGKYDLKKAFAGLVLYFKDLHQRREKKIDLEREAKLKKENTILDMDILERSGGLVSIEEMDRRFRPLLVSTRQKILSSTMTDEEKDELLTEMGTLLKNALTRDLKGSKEGPASKMAADLDQAPADNG